MIKRRPLIILSILVLTLIIACLIWYWLRFDINSKDKAYPPSIPAKAVDSAPKLNGRKVINLPEGKEQEALKDLKLTNSPSEEGWKEGLEKTLRAQGGDALKAIKIDKIDSLIWSHGGVALNVESVRIIVTNDKGEDTSFRAMIDSQNGKILQTWDNPIVDPINPRQNFGLKPDPRYFND